MYRKKLKNPVFLFYLLVFYVFAQFLWWWYLIYKLNHGIYAEQELWNKKFWMIFGEGLVFFVLLILGIVSVKNAIKRQNELNKKEENFILSVTHELKTPIASSQLFLETLLKHNQLSEEKRNDLIKKSIEEMERLNYLVNNILQTRNIESKNHSFQPKEENINLLIENRIGVLQKSIGAKFKTVLDLENIMAFVDKNSFESIISNLYENATKYSPENSEIKIELIKKEKSFLFKIADFGKGIKDENKSKALEKFYREEDEKIRSSKGTGLGLFIVQSLVEQHNGKIYLKNNQPNGLIVEIEMPIK